MNVVYAAIALSLCLKTPVASSNICAHQTTKPSIDPSEIIINVDDSEAERFSKIFRGYVQIEDDGKNLYVPFPISEKKIIFDFFEPGPGDDVRRVFKYTLNGDCGHIELLAIKESPVYKIIYVLEKLQFQAEQGLKNCTLELAASQEEGVHTYDCTTNSVVGETEVTKHIATLVIQHLVLEKFLPTPLPEKYDIIWK